MSVMGPLISVWTETLHHHEALTPEKRGILQRPMSGQCHPQLEGPLGT